MNHFTQDGNHALMWRGFGETLRIEAWGRDGLRVRATRNSAFTGRDWALLPLESAPAAVIDIFVANAEADADPYDIAQKEASISAKITHGGTTATITQYGKVTFTNGKGEVLLEEFVRTLKDNGGLTSALRLEGREYRGSMYGNYKITQRFESDRAEKLYGMGQYQQPFLNIKGCAMELAHRNSQASVPFLLSNKGYGLLWNNPAIGKAAFNLNVTEYTAESSKEIDYWITSGDTPAAILENYTAATGRPPMMPDYATGFWQCKLRYQTQDELMEVAREHKRRGLPLSVIVADFFHWPFQGDWRFDLDYWPDPAGMVRELAEMGVKLMVSVWPTVETGSENYKEMLERGYLVQAERGVNVTMGFGGRFTFYDVTHPEARAYVWSKIKKGYIDYGIKDFWLDIAEPEYLTYDWDNFRYHSGPAMETGNIFPVLYAQNFYDGLKSAGEDEIVSLVRCAWAGSQRCGALVWSGDIHSTFESFRNQFAAGLSMGLSGIPWWTTDIGGFHGAYGDDPAFRELLVRWLQYGAFCPVMRLHGVRRPIGAPIGPDKGGQQPSGAANEVWSFGEEVLAIFKKYMNLREKMRPYVARLFKDAHETGAPLMRPLFYDFPDDAACWEIEDQYMFGPDMLVAPVLHAGARSRRVYLPEGRWVRLGGGATVQGGQTLECPAPLDEIPVFIRERASGCILS
jgi:alpha-D-xyloside xylohydrolase